MIETENFKLNKAELTDPADITELNKNFDIIDQQLADVIKKVVTYTPFCVNSGSIDAEGNENILYTDNTTGVQDVEFIPPILSENGSIGGSSFAVSGDNEAWKLFDKNSLTFLNYTGSLLTITIYNPTILQFNNLLITSVTSNNFAVEVDGLNGNIWENIGRFSTREYKAGVSQLYNLKHTNRYNQIRVKFIANSQINFALSEIRIGAVYNKIITINDKILRFRGSVTATNANRKTFILNEIAPIDLTNYAEKYYSVFVDETGTVYLCDRDILVQKHEPTHLETYFTENSVWVKTLEPITSYIYKNETWVDFDAIPLGEIFIKNDGSITNIETYKYNQNGYSINVYSKATSKRAGVMRLGFSDEILDPTNNNCVMTPANVITLINNYKVLKYQDIDNDDYLEIRDCNKNDRLVNWSCDSDGLYLLKRQKNGGFVIHSIKLNNPTREPSSHTSLIDWEAMETACAVTETQLKNINNADWGVVAYGGDFGGTHSDGVEFYHGDIIIKKPDLYTYKFEDYDEIIIISCTDNGESVTYATWKKWEWEDAIYTYKKFNLLKSDNWQWTICGKNPPTGRHSNPYDNDNPRLLVPNNDSNNCGIIDIIGVKY